MKAYLFPGQGSQFPGMGKDLYNNSLSAKKLFNLADELLDRNITFIMFEGTQEALKQTDVAQLAIFLHAVITVKILPKFKPDMVAGHSLGELSALVANSVISFEDGLSLVAQRAAAMQEACTTTTGTMAAIIGLPNEKVEEVCNHIDQLVIAANYNCPGQLVISGSIEGVALACEMLKEAGARKTVPLKVSGAFHSPLMEPARVKLAEAVNNTNFKEGVCPVYQNICATPIVDPILIKQNLIQQLVSPIRWTQTIQNMIKDGVTEFVECGPSNVLQGLVRKIDREIATSSLMPPTA